MSYHGDYAAASTVTFKFTTRQATGAPTTLAGTPVVSIYKNGSTTESTTGVTLTADYDSRTGLNDLVIDTSADGTFYAAGHDFDAVITTGTVNSVSVVGEVVGSFSLANRSALRPATAGRTLVVDTSGLADANTVKVGPTGSGTAQTARDLGATLGVAGAGLTAVGDTRIAHLDADVSSRSTFTALAAADADTILDRAAGVETSWTVRQALRIMLSALAGKASGLDTNAPKYRDMADTKDRISATTDASGNRTAVTRDAS